MTDPEPFSIFRGSVMTFLQELIRNRSSLELVLTFILFITGVVGKVPLPTSGQITWDPLSSWQRVGLVAVAVAPFLWRGLQQFRSVTLKKISVDELRKLERVKGGELRQSQAVFVNSSQPIESTDLVYARQVMQNLGDNIEYLYVFKLDEDNAGHIANMIVNLVAVSKNENEAITVETAKHNLSKIKDNYRIHMGEESYGLGYCVLNARDVKHAHCYLQMARASGSQKEYEWVDWCDGQAAYTIAQEVRDLCSGGDVGQEPIIRGTASCDFYVEKRLSEKRDKFIDCLKSRIRINASNKLKNFCLADDVIHLCIGDEKRIGHV